MVLCCLFSITQKSYGQLTFESTPITTATVGTSYTYSAFASDGTINVPTITCPTLPTWMSFAADGSTSMVTFGPSILSPGGIAGDSDGNTYVVENQGTNRYIYKIAPDGTANTTWAAVDDGAIFAMNVDAGYLYVSYYNNSVTGGSSIKKISLANPELGQTLVYQHATQGLLSLVFRGGYIYCANWNSSSILKIDPVTQTSVVFVSTTNPFGLGFDDSGLLYIANYSDNTISTFDGTSLKVVLNVSNQPTDVKIDVNGNIYVSFNSSGGIKKYNNTLTTETILVPQGDDNKIWGMNLTPTGSLIFGLNSQNKVARLGTGAVLSGTPALSDIGIHNVTIRATNGAETVDQSFVVTVKGPPTITNFSAANGLVGTDITLTNPTSNSAGVFTYSSSNTAVATVSGNVVTPIADGTTTITATQAASGNYTQGTISAVYTISSCTAPAITTQPIAKTVNYGTDTSFSIAATGTGLSYQWKKNNVNISGAIATTLSLTNVVTADAGSYSCVVTGTCGTVTSSAVDLSVNQIPVTVTAAAKTKVYGTTDPIFNYTVSPSLESGDDFTGVLSRVADEDVATYSITQGTLNAGSKYQITFVGANFSITPKAIKVTAAAKTKVYGETDASLTYSVLPSLESGDDFTGVLSRVAGEDVATYAITQGALSAGSNYQITFVGANFSITKADQAISWSQTVSLGCDSENTVALTATTSSGLPISYTSSNTAVATVSNGILSFNNAGSATITASQAGNVNYNAALVVTNAVVKSQTNLIRKQFDDVIFFDNSSNSFKSYAWYKNGVLVAGQTAQYFKQNGALNGTYYVMATKIDGTVVTTCPLTFSPSIVQEYLNIVPNPVKANDAYQLVTNVDLASMQGARVLVYNILGSLVSDQVVDAQVIELRAPANQGIYIVKMILTNGKLFSKNLLVRN
ncbi:Serine/threonine-protein kinase PknD [Flavobacterium sp. PL0002]|nr:Serine/threonine-protein kinase PknD [Flavobacterium sp. PL002]